jgi:hypothetical protein
VSSLADVVTARGSPWPVIHHHPHTATGRPHPSTPTPLVHERHVAETHAKVIKVVLVKTCTVKTSFSNNYIEKASQFFINKGKLKKEQSKILKQLAS